MTTVAKIAKDLETARRSNNVTGKNILSVFLGEIQTASSKEEITDAVIGRIATRMNKALDEIGTDEAKKEQTYLAAYLPVLYTREQIAEIIEGYIEQGISALTPALMAHFNKELKKLLKVSLYSHGW